MDPNALLFTDEIDEKPERKEDIAALGKSVKDAKVTLIRLLAVHKELSKRLDSLTFLQNAKVHSRKRVNVSVLDTDSFSFASPSSWKFQTPSPAHSRSSSHHRVWSVTTCRSPLISEFQATAAKKECGWGLVCVVLAIAAGVLAAAMWKLRNTLVVA